MQLNVLLKHSSLKIVGYFLQVSMAAEYLIAEVMGVQPHVATICSALYLRVTLEHNKS